MAKKILVTSALPYANGNTHIGHLVEYIQTDIWVRFQKLQGNECYYFCGDDTHGTAIMISAAKQGVSPEEFIKKIQVDRIKDFNDFEIEFTHYSSTHAEENKKQCNAIFEKMQAKGHIAKKDVEQSYCEHDKMFLPDRYVKGTCPKCGAAEQYGDSCDSCGATYTPTELKDAACSVCGNAPVKKKTEHLLFKLNDFKEDLKTWLVKHTDKEVSKKLLEWFDEDLRDWDISRDAPYFGFEIPGHPGKYFYVWVDAPVGYIAASQEWLSSQGRSYEEFWCDDEAEIYHFIGKDIVYFHSLFWPAMLMAADMRTPNHIFVHGMLTVNGKKMSKSKGTFISARTYLNHLDPMYLRYYYACKLSSSAEDIDLNLEDIVARVNSDLVGKITNLASRGASMLTKKMDATLLDLDKEGKNLVAQSLHAKDSIAAHYQAREYSKAINAIRQIAEAGNRYFDEKEPWKLIKEDPEAARQVLSNVLNLYKNIAIYLKPVVPKYAEKVEALFAQGEFTWSDLDKPLAAKKMNTYEHLATRMDKDKVDKMVEESIEKAKAKDAEAINQDASEGIITIDDFTKVDLRIAEIIEASDVPEADKLLKIIVKVDGKQKQIFAGIKAKYKAEDLIGKKVVLVNNLKPRKMRFGLSEGMLLAASGKDGGPFLVTVDAGAEAGFKVK